MNAFARRLLLLASGVLLGVAAGWVVCRAGDLTVADTAFWRDFWSGPPAAGVFALAGALIAFGAAWIAAATARRSARRQEWWDRAEWALGHIMSGDGTARDAGLAAAEVLISEATTTEAAMLDAVTSRFLGPAPSEPMDTEFNDDGE